MGVPTSEVGYTSAMPKGEDHEVHKDMWGIGKNIHIYVYSQIADLHLRIHRHPHLKKRGGRI